MITIDAMGTQTAIAVRNDNGGDDSILALQGNRDSVHHEVIDLVEEHMREDFARVPAERLDELSKKGHGGVDQRTDIPFEAVTRATFENPLNRPGGHPLPRGQGRRDILDARGITGADGCRWRAVTNRFLPARAHFSSRPGRVQFFQNSVCQTTDGSTDVVRGEVLQRLCHAAGGKFRRIHACAESQSVNHGDS